MGKRVFYSNRHRRTGCGRTVQLYLDSTVFALRRWAGGGVLVRVEGGNAHTASLQPCNRRLLGRCDLIGHQGKQEHDLPLS